MNILLAEDDYLNVVILQTMLEEAGYDVVVARNGREAIACLHEREFSVILMDVKMPVLDGIAATKAIRRDSVLKEKANIPIIAVSACDGDNKDEIFAAGVDGYIEKPVDFTLLFKTIGDVVVGRKDRIIRQLRSKIMELEAEIMELSASEDEMAKV